MNKTPHPINPYKDQSEKAFWKSAVGCRHYSDIADLWAPMQLRRSDRVATGGSCFAQHIGRNLALRGANFMDLEPAPPGFNDDTNAARRWGYGVFSCRYGNLYTTRQLLQLFDEAHGNRTPQDIIWEKNGRFFDALRPNIDPVGQKTAQDVKNLRKLHLDAVRKMFAELDVYVFTMGLTECWMSRHDETVFPVAPGVVAGRYDPSLHVFHNLRHSEIYKDMVSFRDRLKIINKNARILLTVSPVALAATATDQHVLTAATYSKSTLRSVAGELAEAFEDIHYFPSYEIISSHPARGMFFEPGLRNVNQFGVDFVMRHFFSGALEKEFGDVTVLDEEEFESVCDESLLEQD